MKTHRAVLCLLPLLLPACGGGNAPGDAQAGDQQEATAASSVEHLKACDFVTSDQVSQVFGTDFQKGELKEHGTGPDERYFSICVFNGADPTSMVSASVSVRPTPDITDPAAALEAQVADVRKNASPDYALDPVPELGPGAGWDGTSHQLTVFEPGLMLIFGAQGREVTKEQVVHMATIVLGELPKPAS
ncbi:MAG: hypothetical protein PVJ02_10455 [Gemmatimonadota bacterium]|jgi:hypothetical protein